MAPHSSILAWKIPWTEEPGRLQSMGSLRVGHDWVTSLSFSLSCIGEGNGNPLQHSCLENPRDGGAWWAAVYGVAQSQTRLKRLSNTMQGFSLSGLFHLAWYPPDSSMLLQMTGFSSFLRLNTIPCIYAPHFFIHSFVNGHSGFFHVLAVMNSAAINIGVHLSLRVNYFISFRYHVSPHGRLM